MRIVRLGSNDIEDIHEVWHAAGLHHRADGRDSTESMRRELEGGPGFVLGAFDGEKLVAVVLGTDDGRKGWINRLAVLPEHRRAGLGQSLIAACEEEFVRRGIELSACLIESGNEASIELFEAAGYTTHDIAYYRKKLSERDW